MTLLAAFALPAAADASFQARIIDGAHVSLTGTDDPEAIAIGADASGRLTHDQTSPGFASPLDFDTATPGVQAVTGSPIVNVDAEGGDDRIRMTATIQLRADGGEGDDQIYGSQHHDVIQGGVGDDYAEGRGSSDAIYLGAGDDRYMWNGKTDGNDLVVGGDGDDRATAWGSQLSDEFNVYPMQSTFYVSQSGASRLHVEALEEVSLPLFAGDDIVTTELLPAGLRLDVDGGAGDDELSGGPGDDDLGGGDGRDRVSGYGGDDVLSGETVVGDIGNDRMTVNAPGALAIGDEGYDITNVVTTGGDDSLSISPQSGFVRAQGTASGEAYVAHAESEAVVVQTGGGNDTVTVQPGTGNVAPVSISAGTGDDVLRGSDGLEHLFGSAGQDVLDGGLAPDRLDGSSGSDVIRARDRAADTIACGQGDDIVIADLAGLDQLLDAPACEQVDGATATGPIPLARVATIDQLRLGGAGTVKVPVTCSAGARGGCQGTVTIVSADVMANGFTTALRLGTQSVSLAPGTTTEVVVPIPHGEDLARAFGKRLLNVQAQVLTGTAEHTTTAPLNILR